MTYGADAQQKRRVRELPDSDPPSELRGLQEARAVLVADGPATHYPRSRSHSATGSLRGLVSGCRRLKNDEEHSESREISVDFIEDDGGAAPKVRGWRSQR